MTGVSDDRVTLYLVRHGRAAGAWHESRDPGLDAEGRGQAEAAAATLDTLAGRPLALYTSPLQRARETAAPLAQRWGVTPVVESGVAEVPSPGLSLEARGSWLQGLLRSRWPDLDPHLWQWRDQALATLRACERDTVFMTHAVLINAVVAAVTNDPRVLVFRPDYCSVTTLHLHRGGLTLDALGREAETRLR
ncbi:histidine phosphatase family protein [Aquisalimonas asiatica]|uniref:Broad specificity phosphatase PhoE n=1 Tax=Aquisalimonas asiatica TaxID=406100 RepID=A0A1H8QVR7_9GAMM|nr:histidine phosphatase family protein [Aquisalimonas asiatica]SEO58282.1 Broad specificity phosphatase PhoE [Aquisalimonas asiatica]